MNTIEAFENDILLQLPFLQQIQTEKILSKLKQKKSIFCGTGDSFAAALLAEAFSNYTVRAADPLDLIKNPDIVRHKDVYLVSISGNTVSNKKLAKIAKKSVAITSNTKSKLAMTCSNLINLQFPNSGVFTSGSIGFLASTIVCISLVHKIKIKNIYDLFEQAVKVSNKIKIGKKIFFLGNMNTYPIAMYAAAKIYEVLGMEAYYERIEQFLHMGLFSVSRGDTVILFEGKNQHNQKISKNLKKSGVKFFRIDSERKNKFEQVIFCTFVAQIISLTLAKKNHQKECYFVTAKKLRNASSNMIY